MKQIILIGVLTGLLTATIPLRAQVALRDTDGQKGSRLELGRTSSPQKTSASRIPTQRFSIMPNPTLSGLDRSITLNKNSAINEHYRSLLLPHASGKAAARTSAAETSSPASEIRQSPSQEGKSDNRLFANDKLWISNAYPNPADDVAELDYQFTGAVTEAKLVLLNVLGTPVPGYEQIDLERNDRKVRIVTRPLDTGYYLYQLTVDGKKVATKRLLVRHQ
ncbi:T9SS type A sorting domain-containing protein [Spirosoma sp. KCTC 42546]|uniref:T9SS type A sorting domain-containing protein n=1 Tax=Spirosoma sp. KCTC 42546 TaxID=2520506 RepID=UPI001158A0DB|nr:T9SS type A sorting domain-containing protein [Spirosoma sp. KCTC 42546]QDK79155.1 T9SS type A sorting domain-containing protein [Spirosoma sp. KCTC 42546]